MSPNNSKYKSWSGLKKQMEALLCDALKGQIAYTYTRYNKDRGSFGRAAITLGKSEVIAFSWDVETDIQWADEYTACLENPNADQATVHAALMKDKWMPQGTLCHHDFLHAVADYLNTDVQTALRSDNYLLRVFAFMDRRVGKRTLVRLEDSTESLPAWVKQFYRIRCEAESI